jgi:transcriptional regulator with XRE-family HTH domain
MRREHRLEARELRYKGLSVIEISERMRIARSTIAEWVRDIELTEGQIDDLREKAHRFPAQLKGANVNRERARAKRVLWQEQGRAKAREHRFLHGHGCMLYWAEGGKQRNEITFVNSDPNMMLIFIKFLRQELLVPDDRMRIHLHCHATDIDEIARIQLYWLDILQLPRSALKNTNIKIGSEKSHHILINGVCGLRVHSTEYVQHIFGAIQEYGGFDEPAWLG